MRRKEKYGARLYRSRFQQKRWLLTRLFTRICIWSGAKLLISCRSWRCCKTNIHSRKSASVKPRTSKNSFLKYFQKLLCSKKLEDCLLKLNFEVWAVQKLESNVGKSPETIHTTKKSEKYINILDLVKNLPTIIVFTCKIRVDTAENEPLKVWRLFK